MNPTQYIKESVDHQFPDGDATPEDYIGMAQAFDYALRIMYAHLGSQRYRDVEIWDLSSLICPIMNASWVDYRKGPAVFLGGGSGVDAIEIQPRLLELISHQSDISAAEFYWRFESIHPWPDGNGRVGSLIYNVLTHGINGNPQHPPLNPAWEES